jgi:hypothetical protein
MDMIDLALQMKDFEWAKQLQEEKDRPQEIKVDYNSLHKQVESDSKYNEVGKALEDITSQCIVKTYEGLRNINLFSEYDRLDSQIVVAEKDSYKKGETIKYYSPDIETLYYLKGYYQGYYNCYTQNYNESQRDKTLYNSLNDAIKNKDYYMNKYFELLEEKYNKKWYKFWK